jgi:hypothetical protein
MCRYPARVTSGTTASPGWARCPGSGWASPSGAVAGLVLGALRNRGVAPPAPISIALIAAAAMASSDVPLKLFEISDPSQWEVKDWAADALPHLFYGLVTYAAIRGSN